MAVRTLLFFRLHASFAMPADLNDLLQCDSIDATPGESPEVLVGFGIAISFAPSCYHFTSVMKG